MKATKTRKKITYNDLAPFYFGEIITRISKEWKAMKDAGKNPAPVHMHIEALFNDSCGHYMAAMFRKETFEYRDMSAKCRKILEVYFTKYAYPLA